MVHPHEIHHEREGLEMRDAITNRWRKAKRCLELANALREAVREYGDMLAEDGRPLRGESSDGMSAIADSLQSQFCLNESVLRAERNARNAIYYGQRDGMLKATFTNGRDMKPVVVFEPDESCDIPYIGKEMHSALCRLLGDGELSVMEGFDVFVQKSGGFVIKGKV